MNIKRLVVDQLAWSSVGNIHKRGSVTLTLTKFDHRIDATYVSRVTKILRSVDRRGANIYVQGLYGVPVAYDSFGLDLEYDVMQDRPFHGDFDGVHLLQGLLI